MSTKDQPSRASAEAVKSTDDREAVVARYLTELDNALERWGLRNEAGAIDPDVINELRGTQRAALQRAASGAFRYAGGPKAYGPPVEGPIAERGRELGREVLGAIDYAADYRRANEALSIAAAVVAAHGDEDVDLEADEVRDLYVIELRRRRTARRHAAGARASRA